MWESKPLISAPIYEDGQGKPRLDTSCVHNFLYRAPSDFPLTLATTQYHRPRKFFHIQVNCSRRHFPKPLFFIMRAWTPIVQFFFGIISVFHLPRSFCVLLLRVSDRHLHVFLHNRLCHDRLTPSLVSFLVSHRSCCLISSAFISSEDEGPSSPAPAKPQPPPTQLGERDLSKSRSGGCFRLQRRLGSFFARHGYGHAWFICRVILALCGCTV